MSNRLQTAGLAVVMILSWAALGAPSARADEACDSLAQYLWSFQPSSDPVQHDDQDADLIAGHKAPKSLDRAYPFPNMPTSVSSGMDRDTLVKVTGLYDRYVLLDRSISDLWKDKYAHNPPPGAAQKFATERSAIFQDMTKLSKAAKDEVVRYGFRSRACFDAYESYVMNKQVELRKQLADVKSTMRANEEIWSHAEAAQNDTATAANGAAVMAPTPIGGEEGRAPASTH
jgi:hypothetical protein